MRSLNRVLGVVLLLLAAAALASFLRVRGDRHRLGGATDLEGSLQPLQAAFNDARDSPRLLLVLAPACPVCRQGAETVRDQLLPHHRDLLVFTVWMEALPFDITRNPARRVEDFAGESQMMHFYDMQQVAGRAVGEVIDWRHDSQVWDIFMVFPPGVTWEDRLPTPSAWFHQRQEAHPDHFRTGDQLAPALAEALGALPSAPPGRVSRPGP